MNRTFALILAALAAVAVFVGLVYTVLVAAHVAEPAGATVHGLTLRRLWATAIMVVALAGVVAGGLALTRPSGRRRATAALVAGGAAVINGALNLAVADGGPGSGNGVVGAAAALVLGLVALALGKLALARNRRASFATAD